MVLVVECAIKSLDLAWTQRVLATLLVTPFLYLKVDPSTSALGATLTSIDRYVQRVHSTLLWL